MIGIHGSLACAPLPTWVYIIGVLVEGAGATGVVVTPAVGAVGDGRDGLARALAGTYAAVILDVMLPGMSGLDVVRELRRRRLRAEDLFEVGGISDRARDVGAEVAVGAHQAAEALVARGQHRPLMPQPPQLVAERRVTTAECATRTSAPAPRRPVRLVRRG